jgi:Flp pilus assembly protein TadG
LQPRLELNVERQTKTDNRQRGAVMIWVALFMLFILGFVALGIDTAKLAGGRTQLQNAADAAALAGASAISFSTGTVIQDTAIVRAQATALQNKAYVDKPEAVVVAAGDVTFPTTTQVKVTVRRQAGLGGEIVTHIAQVLGITSLGMTADATARVEPASEVSCGLAPLFMSPPPGEEFQVGCATNYTLKYGGGAGSNGNYGGLSLPGCDNGPCAGMSAGGAATYRCLLENGYCCPISIGQVLQTEPGSMAGPTRQGLTGRFNNDTDRREGICYNQYTGNGMRVIYVPITTDPAGGRTDVTVVKFAAFFLTRLPGSGGAATIVGEFLYETVPGSGGGPSTGTAYTIRLIE